MGKFFTTVLLILSTINLAYAVDATQRDDGITTGLMLYSDNDNEFKIWGRVDTAIMSVNNVGTENKRATVFLNSGEKTSVLGFKYKRLLDNGWETGVRLDAQVMPSDGGTGDSASSGSTNNIWARNAYIWINAKEYGRFSFGRQDNAAYTVNKLSDARPFVNFGANGTFWSDNSYFNGTATSKTGLSSLSGGTQQDKTIRYDSPTWKGFNVAVNYSPGGVAGDTSALTKYDYAFIYKPKDNFLDGLQAGVAQHLGYNTSGVLNARTTIIGGNYIFDDKRANIAANWILYENPSISSGFAEFQQVAVSGKYFLTPKWNINGGLYHLTDEKNNTNKATQFSLGTQYYLSNRVMAYLDWAKVANEGNMGFAPFGLGAGNLNSLSRYYSNATVTQAGKDIPAVMIGFQIEF